MATTKQKDASRRNIAKARDAKTDRGTKKHKKRGSAELSTAERNNTPAKRFAFPKQRKEPLTDARHVRNAVARFDQVEGVSDTDRSRAWKRILSAARKYRIHVSAHDWRQLLRGGKARKRRG